MGVHTLGRADITNSGFHGTWVTDQQRFFNNQVLHVHRLQGQIFWHSNNCLINFMFLLSTS